MCIKRRGSRPVNHWNYLTLRLHECGLYRYTSRDRAPAPWASAGRGQPAWASAILVCVFCGCSPSNEPPQEEEGARRTGMAPTILGVLKLGSCLHSTLFSQALSCRSSAAKHACRCPRGRSERAPRAHSRWAGGAHTREARAGTGMRAAGRAALRLLGQGRGVEADGRRLQAGSASTSGGAASSWIR